MDPSYLRITIDGRTLEEFNPGTILRTAEISQELNEHAWAELVMRQPLDRRFPVEDSIGKEIKIEGVEGGGESRAIFSGIILEGEIEYEISSSYRCRLKAVSLSYKMDLTPRFSYFPTHEVSSIVNELVGHNSLQADLQDVPSDSQQTWHTQWGETDWSFVKRLAAEHECWVRPDHDGIQVVYGFDATTEHTVPWRQEGGLIQFSVRGRMQQKKMDGAQYDPATMDSQAHTNVHSEPEFYPDTAVDMINAVKTESGNQLPNGYLFDRSRARTQALYNTKLERESRRSIGTAITCRGRSRSIRLVAGDTINVSGALDGAGKYALTKVVHKWSRRGYVNEFEGTPYKHWSGPIPQTRRWFGTAPARVVENADPDNAGRVAIQFYWMPGDKKTHWVRRLSPYAGADRGIFFTPEVGDEVIVGFEDGDVERPVILGSTWNGVHTAPVQDFWGGEYGDDDVKRIVTKSGHRIALSDKEGKESISMATPNNTKFSLFESSNETNRPTIQLCCENGDILFVAADGRIHNRAAFFSRDIG